MGHRAPEERDRTTGGPPRSGPTAEGLRAADRAADAYRTAFADRLLSTYLLGSLAHGGFAPAVSDVDLALVLRDRRPRDAARVERVLVDLRGGGGLLARLSVFWASDAALRAGRDDGRFPALDRFDLAAHGRLLHGAHLAPQVVRPTADELLVESARFALGRLADPATTDDFRRPGRLLTDPRWFTKAVLFPVRFLCTTATGRPATNDEAVRRHLDGPAPVAADLVLAAVAVRNGGALHAERTALLLAADLVPLYLHYIDELLPRLAARPATADLADGFARWRRELASS